LSTIIELNLFYNQNSITTNVSQFLTFPLY